MAAGTLPPPKADPRGKADAGDALTIPQPLHRQSDAMEPISEQNAVPQAVDHSERQAGSSYAAQTSDVRILLRALRPRDLAALSFFRPPSGAQDAKPAVGMTWASSLATADPRSSGGWAIVTAGARELVGLIIYHAVDAKHDAAIISYGLELDWRGLGLGSEAVARATLHLLGDLGFETLFADVELTNVASRRLLTKVGFNPVTVGNTPGVDVAPDRPAQRWIIGRRRWSNARSIINLGSVGAL